MKKLNLWLAIFTCSLVLTNGLVSYILYTNNLFQIKDNFLIQVLGIAACAWVPFLLECIFKLKISTLSCIFFEIFLFYTCVLGTIWNFYTLISFYDKIVHASSGILIAVIIYDLLKCTKHENNFNYFWLFILIFSICLAVGSLWEIWEFATDFILDGNTQQFTNKIGRAALLDTMIDTICNTIGAIIGSVLVIFIQRKTNALKKAD